ncbi:hypothetical protein [Priestia megaterium]|uniref:hypothetical protein n=1 Tax=Priestia megaterium TaxID=1404 RepID=UPI0018906B20|nr:hypothetical protein [Priestia megaterium]
MKKILAFILIISIVGVLASCGKEEANTELKPKTCEQIEPCKTALQYVTYDNQGAADKVYKMDTKNESLRSYGSLSEARGNIKSDYKKYQHQKIDKYEILEYEIYANEKYVYKIRFQDLRTDEPENFTVGLEKQGDKYLVTPYLSGASKSAVTINGKVIDHKKYYSKGLTDEEKDELEPSPIEK